MHNKRKKKDEDNNEGIMFFKCIGIISVICGISSFLILCVAHMFPQDYEKYNVSLFFNAWFVISLIIFLLGAILIASCKFSRSFQRWAQNNVMKYAKRSIEKEIQKEKVK